MNEPRNKLRVGDIVAYGYGGGTVYMPWPAVYVVYEADDTLAWLSKEDVKAELGLFHWRFKLIHRPQ